MWVSLIIWCIAARLLCFFALLLNKKNQLFFYGKCICLSFTISLQKKNNNNKTNKTNPHLAKSRCGCMSGCSPFRGCRSNSRTHTQQETCLAVVFTSVLLKEVSVAFLVCVFCFVLFFWGAGDKKWSCGAGWCVIAVCGGSRGCISSCLASERVKGSEREA